MQTFSKRRPPADLDAERGFTLVEILIALALMSIITTAIYQLYISQYKTWVSQDLITEMQQNARVSIDTISRDLLLAGYSVEVTKAILTESDQQRIAVRYKDPEDNKFAQVMYWRESDNVLYRKLRKETVEDNLQSPPLAWADGQPLSDNVTEFSISYFNASGASTGDITKAYRIKVTVTVRTSKDDPITRQRKSFTLSTDVRPRNIGIGGVAADTTPPETPERPTVTDPNMCGTLEVTWPAVSNVAGDLAGYTLYIGVKPAAGETSYTRVIELGNVTSYTVTGLDNGVKYGMRLAARDTSGNISPWSPEAYTGDGTTPANDTTPNANAPGQPVGLDATATTSGSPRVTLTWTANSVTYPTDTDVRGYEVWRKKRTEGDSAWTNLTPTLDDLVAGTTYTDTSIPEGQKCTIFDYMIVAVNSCDPNLKSTPSATVYGDGGRTAFVDVPNNGTTNTMPSDSRVPAAPSGPVQPGNKVLSKAGYRRTFINWNNPSDTDLSYVSIRYNSVSGATPPYPASPTSGTGVENGYDGRFDSSNTATFAPEATGLAYTHQGSLTHWPGCDTSPSCLRDGYTYSYSLFAVDSCGNISPAAETAQTTVGQCGEETTGPTAGAPPAPSNFTIAACSSYSFTWDRIDDTYPSGEYDLAGFYMYKRIPGVSDFGKASGLILNPPSGSVSWSDLGMNPDTNPAYAGNTYEYYTIGIDCIREQNPDPSIRSNPWATIAEAPSPAPARSPVLTVRPGRATFGNNTTVTTGVVADPTVSGNTEGNNYYHNTVDVRLKNTSAGSVKLKTMQVSWGNTLSYLKQIIRIDTGEAVWSQATPAASGDMISFGAGLDVMGIGDVNNPLRLRFVFTAPDGSVGQFQDMRTDTVTVNAIEYEKVFERDGTAIFPSCTIWTPETIRVPAGPSISNTVQKRTTEEFVPSSRTAGDLTVSSGLTVEVHTNVTDRSNVGIDSVRLYYKETARDVDVAPSSGYTEINMVPVVAGGTEYKGSLPVLPDKRVWYYIIARDGKGNFDRNPEIQNRTYVYDQQPVDPCLVTPKPPTVLIGSADGLANTVTLSWTPPTQYTDGTTIVSDPLKYKVYRRAGFAGSFNPVTSGGCSGDLATISCTDTLPVAPNDVNGIDYSYYVRAKNSCTTEERLSSESNTYTECVGSAGVSIVPSASSIKVGEGFDLTAYVCALANDSNVNEILVHNDMAVGPDDDYFHMVETGNTTGTFKIKGSCYEGQTTITTSGTGYCSPEDVCLYANNEGDTITFDKVCYPAAGCNGAISACTGTPSPGTYATVTVSYNPCLDTPNPPTGLNLSIDGGNDAARGNNTEIHVKFTAPQLNTDGTEVRDLDRYALAVTKNGVAHETVTIPLSACTSSLPNPPSPTTCDYTYRANAKMKDAEWGFAVKAVDSCGVESSAVGPKSETCTGTSCPATY